MAQAQSVPGTFYLRLAPGVPLPTLTYTDRQDSIVAALRYTPGVQQVLARYGVVHMHKFGLLKVDKLQRTFVVTLHPAEQTEACMAELNALPEVELTEPKPQDRIHTLPNDPLASKLWYLAYVKAEQAWAMMPQGSPMTKVAIVDNAVNPNHVDLVANMLPGRDVADNDDDPAPPVNPDIIFWHGTHTAGTAGAVMNNEVGIAGMSPYIGIIPIKTTKDENQGAIIDNGYEGVQWALLQGAHIISMSWGNPDYSQVNADVIDAAYNAGAILVSSSGNENIEAMRYPCSFPGVVCVAATDTLGRRADFSNYGAWVTVSAPGTGIHSTIRGSGYISWEGTSMATPMVAGLLALGRSYAPGASSLQLTDCLISTATPVADLGTEHEGKMGAGIIQAEAYLQCLGAYLTDRRDPAGQAQPSVYPNPARDQTSIWLPNTAMVQLYGPTGSLLWQQQLPAGSHVLPIQGLSSGVYLLRTQAVGIPPFCIRVVRL